ncbi:hypothetical protein ACQ7B2_16340, partial [Escherichia coli]
AYDAFETKRQTDAVISRYPSPIATLAVGRIAQKFRLLLERDKGTAREEFRADSNLGSLTDLLRDLGYEWDLETVD